MAHCSVFYTDEIRKETEKWGASFEDHDSQVEKCTHLITTEKYVKKSIMPAKSKQQALYS